MISVIIPSFNEEKMIEKTAKVIHNLLFNALIEHELIFVDDGSMDSTWEKIKNVAKKQNSVRGIHFSRNFGKEAAIFAGMQWSRGACCVVIDCDLQHPPEKIVDMYRLWQEGYEIVEAVKSDRGKESVFHSFAAKIFYKIISKVTSIDMSCASDYKLLDRKAMNVLLNMKERNTFFRALSSWIGFKTIQIDFEVQKREVGVSKWSTFSLIRYAINNITSFSSAPMQIVTLLGIIILITSVIFGGISFVQKFLGTAIDGFTTVILLQTISSSIIMISLGIIGFYISKIYDEIKARPKFIVAEECGETENAKETW